MLRCGNMRAFTVGVFVQAVLSSFLFLVWVPAVLCCGARTFFVALFDGLRRFISGVLAARLPGLPLCCSV